MSTHSICFRGEIKKIVVLFGWKKKISGAMLMILRGMDTLSGEATLSKWFLPPFEN